MNQIEKIVESCWTSQRMEVLQILAAVAKPEFEFEIYKQIDRIQKEPSNISRIPINNVWFDIIAAVSEVTGVHPDEILEAKNRKRDLVICRQILIWSMRKICPHFSQEKLGKMFVIQKNYSTVGYTENVIFPEKYSAERSFRLLAKAVFDILEEKGYPIKEHANKLTVLV